MQSMIFTKDLVDEVNYLKVRCRERMKNAVYALRVSVRCFVKRAIDIVFALAGIIISGPIMLAAAVAVKLESHGPAIYSQQRVGKDGKLFNIYKLRSMRTDAEKDGPKWATHQNDSRVTKIGAFLRKSHIDELPQFFNILKGDMSVVGPRPERPCFVEGFENQIPHYARRHTVKPGLTGLAQIRYTYDTTIEDVTRKLKYDLIYAKHMSTLLDLRIMYRTFVMLFFMRGV